MKEKQALLETHLDSTMPMVLVRRHSGFTAFFTTKGQKVQESTQPSWWTHTHDWKSFQSSQITLQQPESSMMLSSSVESGSWPWCSFVLHVCERFFSFFLHVCSCPRPPVLILEGCRGYAADWSALHEPGWAGRDRSVCHTHPHMGTWCQAIQNVYFIKHAWPNPAKWVPVTLLRMFGWAWQGKLWV